MKKQQLLIAALSTWLFLGAVGQTGAMDQNQATPNLTTQNRTQHHYVRRSTSTAHKRHMKTAKRVAASAQLEARRSER